jgi:hypothetical protein
MSVNGYFVEIVAQSACTPASFASRSVSFFAAGVLLAALQSSDAYFLSIAIFRFNCKL